MTIKRHTKSWFMKEAAKLMAHGKSREAAIMYGKAEKFIRPDDFDSMCQIMAKKIEAAKPR